MYCPKCGTRIDGFPCPVCGATSTYDAVARAGAPIYAGWWSRVGATVLDNLILAVPSLGAYLLGDAVASATVGVLLAVTVQAVYMILLLSHPSGQTIGNRLVGTRVRDARTGQAISRQQAARRWVLLGLYFGFQFVGSPRGGLTATVSLLALVDVLFPLMNPKRQTWHDLLAGTVVVRG
ncbi:MAG: RDD family protein [Acidimicrobiales bacterium]